MRILIVGCEYSGTTTLAKAVFKWGTDELGAEFGLIHDHWKLPQVGGHTPIDEDSFLNDQEQLELLDVSPRILEQMQRHSLYYHIQPGAFMEGREHEQGFYPDYLAVGMHIDDAIYGPLYFNYGAEDQPAPRSVVTQNVERALIESAPDIVLVLLEASVETIVERMHNNPHPHSPLKEGDLNHVISRYKQEYERSLIPNKFQLDTTSSNLETTLDEFVSNMQQYLP